jgi:hypothetical protein
LAFSFDANASFFESNKDFHGFPHLEIWDSQTSTGFLSSDAFISDPPFQNIITEHQDFFLQSWDISTTQLNNSTWSWLDEFGRQNSLSKSSEGRALDHLSLCQPSAITEESSCITTNFPSSAPSLDTRFSLPSNEATVRQAHQRVS